MGGAEVSYVERATARQLAERMPSGTRLRMGYGNDSRQTGPLTLGPCPDRLVNASSAFQE